MNCITPISSTLRKQPRPQRRSRSDEARRLNALEAEYGNLNAALAWCLEHPDRAANALRMCGSLGHFWRSAATGARAGSGAMLR